MINFKRFLIEYLTDEQRERYNHIQMTDKARADTDHFFGVGNDKVHNEIEHDDKSEIHKQLENHLGRSLTHDEYRTGIVKDKYDRDVKLGRMIKDNNLRNQFDQDVARKTGYKPTIKTTTVRGIEVAGQTNPTPNAEHPNGHSWPGSCKNLETGINKHYLRNEIKHGTVVHFVHDHNGQEIYRATLQPHHNEQGHVAYSLDAEYGIKHPSFTKSAHEVASKLSGEYKPGVFRKHDDVYNDSGIHEMLHPNITEKHIDNLIDRGEPQEVLTMLGSKAHALTSDHITRMLNHKHSGVREAAIAQKHLITPEHISTALNDEYHDIRRQVLRHHYSNMTDEHISRALEPDMPYHIRQQAAGHPNLKAHHISYVLQHEHDPDVTREAVTSPNLTSEHVSEVLNPFNGHNHIVRAAVFESPNHDAIKPEHISRGLDDVWRGTRIAAAQHKNLTSKHVDDMIAKKNDIGIDAALDARSPAITSEHISHIMKHPDFDWRLKRDALSHRNATGDNVMDALKSGDDHLQYHAVNGFLPKLENRHIDYAINHIKDHDTQIALSRRPELQPHHIRSILSNDDLNNNVHHYSIIRNLATHPNLGPRDIEDILKTNANPRVRRGLLASPDVPRHVLSHMIKHEPDRVIRQDALSHSNTHIDDIAHAASHDPDEKNREHATRILKQRQNQS